jgi:hypothetical protein
MTIIGKQKLVGLSLVTSRIYKHCLPNQALLVSLFLGSMSKYLIKTTMN